MLIGTWSPQHHGDLSHPRGDNAPDSSTCSEVTLAPSCWGPAGYFWGAWLQGFITHTAFPGHVLEAGRLFQQLSPASSVAVWHLCASSTMWPTHSSQTAAESKMPRLVPSSRLAGCPYYHPKCSDGWHRMEQRCLEMGSPGKIRKRGRMKHQLGLDVACRRVGKTEVRARCARSSAGWHATVGPGCALHPWVRGHPQERAFG